MNFINKLERKFGRFGIHNLTMYIIICYVIGYTLTAFGGSFLTYLTLEPALILRGQVWRLITWVLIPPSSLNIFTIIMLFFYYSLGSALERTWGAFRYTLYIFSGLLFTVLGAFLLYFVTGSQYVGFGGFFSTYYISMSIFLAFAASYPNMQVMLYMIIPIKIKWMAYLDIFMLAYNIVTAIRVGNWPIVLVIIASLLNFIIFFLATWNASPYKPSEIKRRQEFKRAVTPNRAASVTKHKCAVCGRTEEDGDDLEFRFCSKCNGNYEYCQDHLFTHQHVK
jgi:hypothetical protein